MGFMAGLGGFSEAFGKAYAQSSSQTRDIQAKREAQDKEIEADNLKDKLRLDIETSKERQAQSAKEGKLVAAAKLIHQDNPNAPYENILADVMSTEDPDAVRTSYGLRDWADAATPAATSATPSAAPVSAPMSAGPKPKIDQVPTDTQMADAFPTDPTDEPEIPGTTGLPQSTRSPEGSMPTGPLPTASAGPSTPVRSNDTITVGGKIGTLKPVKREKGPSLSDISEEAVRKYGVDSPQAKEAIANEQSYKEAVRPKDFKDERDAALRDYTNASTPEDREAARQKLSLMADADNIGKRPGQVDKAGLALAATSDDPNIAGPAKIALDKLDRADALSDARKNPTAFVFDQKSGRLVQGNLNIDENNRRTFVDNQGNTLNDVIEPDDRFYKAYEGVIDAKAEKPIQEYDTKLASTASFVSSANELAKIIEKEPGVLTYAGQVANWGNDLTAEAKAALKLLNSNDRNTLTPQQVADLDRDLNVLSTQTVNLGELKGIYEAKKKTFSYLIGATVDQTGRDVSNAELGRFDDISEPSRRKETAIANLADLSRNAIRGLGIRAASLNNNARVNEFKRSYGIPPLEGGVLAENFSDFASRMNNPEVNDAIAFVDRTPNVTDIVTTPEVVVPQTPEKPVAKYEVGQVVPGKGGAQYRFKGGNDKDPNNYEKVN